MLVTILQDVLLEAARLCGLLQEEFHRRVVATQACEARGSPTCSHQLFEGRDTGTDRCPRPPPLHGVLPRAASRRIRGEPVRKKLNSLATSLIPVPNPKP